jgi:hypothetical protein
MQRPNLPPWLTPDLAAHAVDHSPDEQPEYGAPLEEVVEGSGWAWLEAALLAGYVPHVQGAGLALRAAHTFHMAQIRAEEMEKFHGDALVWTQMADYYREVIAMLEGFVAEMEREMARISQLPQEGADADLRAMWRDDADAAERRAERALERQASALDDNRSAEQLRDRYR